MNLTSKEKSLLSREKAANAAEAKIANREYAVSVAESKAALIVASLLDEDNPQLPNFTEDEGHELMYVVGGRPSQTRDPRLGADVQPPLCFVSREVIL